MSECGLRLALTRGHRFTHIQNDRRKTGICSSMFRNVRSPRMYSGSSFTSTDSLPFGSLGAPSFFNRACANARTHDE